MNSADSNSTCNYGEEQLASLLYDDGDPAEMAQTRAHLAECADCRAELEQMTSMKGLLSAWPNAVNAPRMVYVNERSGLLDRLRRWADGIGGLGMNAVLKPAVAAAAVVLVCVLVLAASVAVLDVRVAPDGSLQIGFAGPPTAEQASSTGRGGPLSAEQMAAAAETAPISREEFREGLTQTVAYLEDLVRSRSDDERRLLIAAIDERMQQQGLVMSEQLRGVMNATLTNMQQQHESDLGLIFSAVDELGVVTGMELQRMNMILASLMPSGPSEEE